ncbi:MAG: NUDIX domain-containing protein [Miniphocaeibacter sp.]|uniref:8-oxo-dGTP diphosphatase n=1 Tax=Miniphocaeibacter sp. TaxID=3100973 RepID=UPI0017ABDD5C|nr:NUDIX domain-containing protein [Gallicola sp.]
MEVVLMNMCMIHDLKDNKVLVLDKVKNEGWEGLTFPGGHVERRESLESSCIREIKEETNLNIENIKLKGIFQWYMLDCNKRLVGLLYYTNSYYGDLISSNREGNLSWMDLETFLKIDNKSDSMDEIMKIYKGKYKEIICYYKDDKLSNIDYIE